MPNRQLAVAMLALGLMLGESIPASAQPYPNKPIRIVAGEAGGGNDFLARLIAQGLPAALSQLVIVENRAPINAIESVAKASPDGYTVLLFGAALWLSPLMQSNVSYNVERDFAPVTLVSSAPSVLVVHPSLPPNSVKELIAFAQARAGELNYASAATGGAPHFSAELFKAMARVNIVRITYKGAGQALNDLIGGQVQLMFPVTQGLAPHVKSGRLKILAVTSAQPSALFPGVPTVAATVPGYESASIVGIFAPAKTPPAIVTRLSEEVVRVINRTDIKEKLFTSGVEIVGGPPEDLAAKVKSEVVRMGKVIKDAGIKGE